MNISSNKKINDFLLDIESMSKNQYEIVISIRELFLKENEAVIEDIKYGGLVFSLS